MADTRSEKPVFVLGVGAQKAGTTWAHGYLDQFAFSDLGQLKEYHIWDALTVPHCSDFDFRKAPLTPREWLRLAKRDLLGRAQQDPVLRRRIQRKPETYFSYFADRLAAPGISLTADITPSYSALSVPVLERIRNGFEDRDIAVKVIFFMREPVERSLSAIRMYRRMNSSREGVDINLTDEAALLAYIDTDQGRIRMNYHETLSRLDAVFAPQDIYTGFYENMFSETELTRFCAFLDLPVIPEFLTRKFNTTEGGSQISPQTRAEAEARLVGVYDACFARFPVSRTLWQPLMSRTV